MPVNTKKVDRVTVFGNPFKADTHGRERSIQLFRMWLSGEMSRELIEKTYPPLLARHLLAKRQWLLDALPKMRGKNLACWCELPAAGEPDLCHAAVLMELANDEM